MGLWNANRLAPFYITVRRSIRMASKTYPLIFRCPATGTTLISHVLVEPGDEHFVQVMRFSVACACCRREHDLDGAHSYETRSRRARRRTTLLSQGA